MHFFDLLFSDSEFPGLKDNSPSTTLSLGPFPNEPLPKPRIEFDPSYRDELAIVPGEFLFALLRHFFVITFPNRSFCFRLLSELSNVADRVRSLHITSTDKSLKFRFMISIRIRSHGDPEDDRAHSYAGFCQYDK